MDILSLLGSTLGLGLMAGLNLYATVLAVGVGIRFGLIHLNSSFGQLQVLAEPWVIGVAAALFAIEFLADKVPWVDSLWDAIHTVVRPAGAAVLGLTAGGGLDPASRLVLGLLTGAVALTGHTTKAGTRLAANHSPEPVSNIVLSLGEDAFAIFGSWLAIQHPFVTLGLVFAFLVVFAVFTPVLSRLLGLEWTALSGAMKYLFGTETRTTGLPEPYRKELGAQPLACLQAIAGGGVRGLKNSCGYLCLTDGEVTFFAKRWFRRHARRVARAAVQSMEFRKGVLIDSLVLAVNGVSVEFLLPKDQRRESERFAALQTETAPAVQITEGA